MNPNQTLNGYQTALSQLDGDGPQYITSNTLDEVSHAKFLNAYLASKGAEPVNFDAFRTLAGSTATGSSGKKRLTNLLDLNVDTNWFVRYRSTTNLDLGGKAPAQALTINNQRTIPENDGDMAAATQAEIDHIQVIANAAAFHFGSIEQGGTSLYATLSQQVTHPEVLKITLSIGGSEIAHFLEWVDFAGNGVQAPVAPVSDSGLTFPNFFTTPVNPRTQPSLIFPVPCEFISPSLPKCAIIRPTSTENSGAVAAITGFVESGLFENQSPTFIDQLFVMAAEADDAVRL